MLGLVKAEQMDPKIHIMEAPVFFLQCYFNFLKLIITNKESCSYRQETNQSRKANFTKTNALKQLSRTKTYK